MLLDPSHPTTVYTAHDVETDVNAGRFSAPVIFGVALAAFGAAIVAFVLWLRRTADGRDPKDRGLDSPIDDERPPICPTCGVTMLPAALSAGDGRTGDWICVECEETGAADEAGV